MLFPPYYEWSNHLLKFLQSFLLVDKGNAAIKKLPTEHLTINL